MSNIDFSQLVTAEDKAAEQEANRRAAIKTEAYRRIIAICPEWKQRNLIAQASILAEKGRANWTAEETAAWEAGEAIWTHIAAIRAASDALEQTLPADFTDNEHWP